MRWGMVIDLRRCVGCQTCTIACKQEHALPAATQWRFVADCEVGEYPNVRRVFLPMQCMHCAEPPCVPVCPTGASQRREDGIVHVVNEGPIVAPDVLAGLTRRFARGETRSAGAGLGLAIVETIVNQTGGKLELLSPASGRSGGFEARLTLRDEAPISPP
jgi:ferredoxin